MNELNLKSSRASWVQENFITQDTEALSADANKDVIAATTELARQRENLKGKKCPKRRRANSNYSNFATSLPAPSNPEERDKLTKIAAAMSSAIMAQENIVPTAKKASAKILMNCRQHSSKVATPEELKKAWLGWHSVAGSHRDEYAKIR